MRLRPLALLALVMLAGCAMPPAGPLSDVRFGPGALPRGVARANSALARDFTELIFELESGQRLDGLLRYETPVRVHLRSAGLAPYRRDLEALLARLRAEAGIDIAETRNAAQAQIVIEAVPAAQITRIFPTAACFIVPGETSWSGFLRRRNQDRLRWSGQRTLQRAAIFLPLDTTPQDVRDCLAEEITQALGPANDLYRLPDSIWNDDNFHGMPTAFDMLMLRTLYQPEFASGMSEARAAAALPAVLDRVNPMGRGRRATPTHPESRAWKTAIEVALSRDAPRDTRLTAARLAVQVAREMRPNDHRLGVALLTRGRLVLRRDPAAAARDFTEAYALFRDTLGIADVRTAQAGVHLAALALGAERFDAAVALADLHAPAAKAGQNAILVAGLLSIKAAALAELGQATAARAVRLDSLRWARYGFGDEGGVLAREQAQLATLIRPENE